MAVTSIKLMPSAVSTPALPKHFDTGEWDWFKENLFNSTGVIDCRTAAGMGHAVAYQGMESYARIYDPATDHLFQFRTPEDTERRDRFLVALWRLENITS